MSESLLSPLLRTIGKHLTATIGLAISTTLTALWHLRAESIYQRLHEILGSKGICGLIFGLFAISAITAVGWRSERKKEKPFFERLVPVRGSGYSLDPKNGELACPRFSSEYLKSYLAHIDDDTLFCQSCNRGVRRFKEHEHTL